jgi:hypothetical protein
MGLQRFRERLVNVIAERAPKHSHLPGAPERGDLPVLGPRLFATEIVEQGGDVGEGENCRLASHELYSPNQICFSRSRDPALRIPR